MFAPSQVVEQAIAARASGRDPVLAIPSDERADGALERAFQSTGGVASAEEIAVLLRRQREQPLSQLARWIVGRQIVHFERCGQTLVPLFQFDLDDMSIRTDVSATLEEIAPALDAEELARWFATPNAWLAGEAPVVRIATDPGAVIHAARDDRFVSTGWS